METIENAPKDGENTTGGAAVYAPPSLSTESEVLSAEELDSPSAQHSALPTQRSDALPDVPPSADLARSGLGWRWPALCFAVTFLAYIAFIPHFILYSSPPTGDQPYYLMDAIS